MEFFALRPDQGKNPDKKQRVNCFPKKSFRNYLRNSALLLSAIFISSIVSSCDLNSDKKPEKDARNKDAQAEMYSPEDVIGSDSPFTLTDQKNSDAVSDAKSDAVFCPKFLAAVEEYKKPPVPCVVTNTGYDWSSYFIGVPYAYLMTPGDVSATEYSGAFITLPTCDILWAKEPYGRMVLFLNSTEPPYDLLNFYNAADIVQDMGSVLSRPLVIGTIDRSYIFMVTADFGISYYHGTDEHSCAVFEMDVSVKPNCAKIDGVCFPLEPWEADCDGFGQAPSFSATLGLGQYSVLPDCTVIRYDGITHNPPLGYMNISFFNSDHELFGRAEIGCYGCKRVTDPDTNKFYMVNLNCYNKAESTEDPMNPEFNYVEIKVTPVCEDQCIPWSG